MPAHRDDPDDDGWDADTVFALGRSADELSPDEQRRRRGSKRFALWALLVVAVIVAVSITLVSLLVDTSSPPASPAAAARRWAQDVVHGDRSDQRRLECDDAQSADVILLVLIDPTGAEAGTAQRSGPGRWRVPVSFDQAGRSAAVRAEVTVVRRGGRYLVC